jgi:hypothetical protein
MPLAVPQPRCQIAADRSHDADHHAEITAPPTAATSLRPLQLAVCALRRRSPHHSRNPPDRQIAIDGDPTLPTAGSFPEGFRTPAPARADTLPWAGIRNPAHEQTRLGPKRAAAARGRPPLRRSAHEVKADVSTGPRDDRPYQASDARASATATLSTLGHRFANASEVIASRLHVEPEAARLYGPPCRRGASTPLRGVVGTACAQFTDARTGFRRIAMNCSTSRVLPNAA